MPSASQSSCHKSPFLSTSLTDSGSEEIMQRASLDSPAEVQLQDNQTTPSEACPCSQYVGFSNLLQLQVLKGQAEIQSTKAPKIVMRCTRSHPLFNRKNVPHSRGMKKADLHVKDFRLEGDAAVKAKLDNYTITASATSSSFRPSWRPQGESVETSSACGIF